MSGDDGLGQACSPGSSSGCEGIPTNNPYSVTDLSDGNEQFTGSTAGIIPGWQATNAFMQWNGIPGGTTGQYDSASLPPETPWAVVGAAIGQYLGKQTGQFAYKEGIINFRNWAQGQGWSSEEIDEALEATGAGEQGAEEGLLATTEFGPWAIGGAIVGAAFGIGSYYLYDLEMSPAEGQASQGPQSVNGTNNSGH